MKLQNTSKRAYQHSKINDKKELELVEIKPGEIKDIPNDIAKLWLKTGDVVEYVPPVEKKSLEDEIKKLKEENADLKTKLKNDKGKGAGDKKENKGNEDKGAK